MLPIPILDKVKALLSSGTGKEASVDSVSPVGGGCINQAFRLNTSAGPRFLKYNLSASFPGMFESEAAGLRLLAAAGAIRIPVTEYCDLAGDYAFILMEYISQGTQSVSFWENFALSLASLHRHTHPLFGLDHPNYIGSLPQSNHQQDEWIPFFVEERLVPMIKMARDGHKTGPGLVSKFDRLFSRLSSLVPAEAPALLHGDLWSGNYLVGASGEPVLIDPAVYYGHREVDLAMTRLFGGFPGDFYRAYQSEFPMEQGWETRMDLHNLYPLMVHVNLFGGGYASEVEHILSRFV